MMNKRSKFLSGDARYFRRKFARLVCAFSLLTALLPAASSDAGLDQWTTNGPDDAGPLLSLAVDPNIPAIVYAGTGHAGMLVGTVFKSTNGGGNWAPANTGLPDVFVRALVIDPQVTSTIYAGTSGAFIGPVFRGMFKSIDGGMNWTPLASTPGPASVVSVAVDPQNPAIIYAGTANLPPDTLFKSTNGGANWTPVGDGLPNGIVSALAIDPQNPAIVYAGTQFGLFKSTNGGAANSWTPMNTGFTPSPTPQILTLVIDPQNTSTVYAGTGGFGVFKSIDGGANWAPSSTGIVTNAGVPSGLINAIVMDPGGPTSSTPRPRAPGCLGARMGSELDTVEHRTDHPYESGPSDQPNRDLSTHRNQQCRGYRECLRLCLRGRLRAFAASCAASDRCRSPIEPFSAGGKRGNGLCDSYQYRFISRCGRQHRATRGATGKLCLPDHRPCDQPGDRNAERAGGYCGGPVPDLPDRSHADHSLRTHRRGIYLHGREYARTRCPAHRDQHAAALVIVQRDPRYRGLSSHQWWDSGYSRRHGHRSVCRGDGECGGEREYHRNGGYRRSGSSGESLYLSDQSRDWSLLSVSCRQCDDDDQCQFDADLCGLRAGQWYCAV